LTSPIGQPPLDSLPPEAPATVEDVRASRRWTWVALAWAIAASAIAIIALVNTSDSSSDDTPTRTAPDLTPRVQKLEDDVNARFDAFSRRLADKAAETDIGKLDKRLAQAEEDASQAKDDSGKQAGVIEQLQADVKDLQQRVDELESQQEQQQGATQTP
jgi:chromosome segregation ATPase